jgi:hypothetical protein
MRKLLLILFIIPFTGTAQVKTIWKDSRFLQEPIKNVLVVSQFYDNEFRHKVEADVIGAFYNKGIGAIAATEVMEYDSMFLYSTLERKLDSAAIDGILIIKLIEERSTDMYIMPEELIPPYAYNYYEYYSFYYYHDLPIISDPNYYRKPGRTFRIDIYLYQNKGDMAIWGGQSNQLDPLRLDKALKSFGKKLIKKLLAEDMISI